MKKVLVTGAGGFVGARILDQWQGLYELCAFPHDFLAEADESSVEAFIRNETPDVVIHTAALSNTQYCEQNPEASYRANVLLPEWVAKAAVQVGAKLISFSSDQVYAGVEQQEPLVETLPLSPFNVYGRHKLEAENRVLAQCPDAVLLRLTWMYDFPGYKLPIRGNLPLNLLKVARTCEMMRFSVNDHRGVSYVREVISNLIPAMELPGGVYNFGSGNNYNMYDTAKHFARLLRVEPKLEPAEWSRNLLMDTGKLKEHGIAFNCTLDAFRQCLTDYGLDADERLF